MKSADLYSGIGNIDERWLKLADEPEKAEKRRGHFVAYELKKLLGVRYLWVFLVAFILLNSLIAFYTAGQTPAAAEPTNMISEFFDDYFKDPDEYDKYHAEIVAFGEKQNRLFMEAMQNGNYDYEAESLPDIYSTDENYSDTRLFAKLYGAIEAAKVYPDVMQSVIDRAEANLSEFAAIGVPEDSFTYKYQLRVIELYKSVRDNVEIDVEYTRGWDEYFAYDIVDVFIFIMLIMLGSLIFAQEKQSGFMPIIRTAKNGRGRTAFAKILTMLLLSSVFTLLFVVSTWAVYGLRIGFSSPDNALQALPSFTLSPYQITIGQYFAVTVAVKLAAFAVFSLLILMLSAVFYNYILIYMCGLGVFGLNFLLYTLSYINPSSPLKNLNLVAVSAVNPLFIRYRAIGIFGAVCGYVPLTAAVFALLLAALSALTIILYRRGSIEIRPVWLDNIVSAVMTAFAGFGSAIKSLSGKRRKNRARRYTRSLVAAETFKTLISSRFIFAVVLLLCVKGWYSYQTYEAKTSYADAVYREYMTTLEGELTDEKLAYLAEERAMIDDTLMRKTDMQQAYMNKEISFEDYHKYLSEYNYAFSRSELLTTIENQAVYLQQKEAECGVRGWFVYDTGWRKLYSGGADLFLYTAILLLLTGSFASEYVSKSSAGGFAQILRSTKNGRQRTFYAKLISSSMIALTLAMLFNAVDIAVIFNNYQMPALTAPLASMQLFGEYGGSLSIIGYLVIFIAVRMLASVLMALLVCSLSELLCRYIPVLGSAVVLTLLPSLCAYFGLAAADKVNYLNLLAGTPLFLQSVSTPLFGSGWTMLALWIAVFSAAVTVALLSARKIFVKGL